MKYFLTDNTSSSIIQRGFLDVLMHCISTIHVFSYSVVKVLYYGPLSRPAGAWLRLFFQFPVEAAISDQKAPVLLSGFWSKSLLGRYKKENLYKKVWHPPILPYRLQHSTVGRTGLNRRVRDGNGCCPCAHRHQTNLHC